MKVLVIGGGAREAAFVKGLNAGENEIFCAPGNAGIAEIAECYPVKADNIKGLLELARQIKPELTVVGPEAPLCDGIGNIFRMNGFRIVAPTMLAAKLEGSKAFAKQFMWRHDIPTANAEIFDNSGDAIGFVERQNKAFVVKADGLAAGKGVTVAKTPEETIEAVKEMMVNKKFGSAGDTTILEEILPGEECSFIVLADISGNVVPFLPSQDFKRRFAGDKGPNTGGMGALAPAPIMDQRMQKLVMQKIVMPTIQGMVKEKNPFSGFLYFGLMITTDGPMVLEFNVRMGDPEASVILPLLKDDLSELLCASTMMDGLANVKLNWHDEKAVCFVLVHEGYPEKSSNGKVISGIPENGKLGSLIIHAGTASNEKGEIVTAGGRILDIVGRGKTFADAIDMALADILHISFEGVSYRSDIALESMANEK